MNICGIVAEYNPFHNGHEYHIKKAKELTGADYIIVCMSGDFVQRGLPAISDKYSRCRAALCGGADMVVELPVIFSTASAENFARGAISILAGLGCDYIAFGSETGDIEKLYKAAEIYEIAEEEHSHEIAFYLSEGYSYVKAINEVISQYYGDAGILGEPESNDKLGIAYIRAVGRLGKNIKCCAVTREGGAYLDDDISSGSALSIRNTLHRSSDPWTIKDLIPEYSYNAMFEDENRSCPVYVNDFSDMMYMKLRSIIDNDNGLELLRSYSDVSQNIAGKIIKGLNTFSAFDRFAYSLLSAEYTMSRINRALTHILLDIKADFVQDKDNENASYARLLGFKKESSKLLPEVKKRSEIPLVSKLADYNKDVNKVGAEMFAKDMFASDLYEHVASVKYSREKIAELRRSPIIL